MKTYNQKTNHNEKRNKETTATTPTKNTQYTHTPEHQLCCIQKKLLCDFSQLTKFLISDLVV